MVNKVIYALICFLMLATFANAQPNITSTSGTYAHNSTVTISGNNFGSKLTGPPVCWDNCESGTPGDKWNYRPSSSSGALGSYGKYGDYRDKVTIDGWGSPYGGAPNPPHNFSNKYYCANTYTTGGGGETQQDECSLGKIVGDVDHAYFSFYYRVDNDWTFNSGSDFNHKMLIDLIFET